MVPKPKRDNEMDAQTSHSSAGGVRSTKKPRLRYELLPTLKLLTILTLSYSLRGKPVTIIVGRGEPSVEFSLPKDLLIEHSGFAKAVLNNSWKEAEAMTIHLGDDDPEHFKVFVGFLHTGTIQSAREGDTREDHDQEWARLGVCWVLGDTLQSASFKDAVADTMIEKLRASRKRPGFLHVTAYTNSVGPSALRRLVVDVAVSARMNLFWRICGQERTTGSSGMT